MVTVVPFHQIKFNNVCKSFLPQEKYCCQLLDLNRFYLEPTELMLLFLDLYESPLLITFLPEMEKFLSL